MQLKMRKNKELLAAIMFFLPQWNYFIAAFLSSYKLPTITVQVYGLTALLAVVVYIWVIKNRRCLYFIAATLLLLFLSYVLNPAAGAEMLQKPLYSSGAISLLLYYLPPFLLLLSGVDLKSFYVYFTKLAVVILITAIIAFVNYILILRVTLPDYMSFAYLMLSSIFVCFSEGVKRNRVLLILSIVGSIVILIGGCRGAFLTLLVFYVLCFMFLSSQKSTARSVISKIAVVLTAAIVFINLNSILLALEAALNGIGYSSRTLSFVSRLESTSFSTLLDNDGRSKIWNMGFSQLDFFGRGLFGDRTILSEGTRTTGVYAHNWALELALDFGLVLGLVAIIALAYIIFKSFVVAIKSNDTTYRLLAISMFSILMVKHMISASFLTSFDFWFYLGICALILVENKKTKKERVFYNNRYNDIFRREFESKDKEGE